MVALDRRMLDLIQFLEWLDVEREVLVWGEPDESHEQTAKKYLAALLDQAA